MGHSRVLSRFNIKNLSTDNKSWVRDENVIVVVAENKSKMIGGVRIHISKERVLLPLEEGVGKYDHKVYEMVKKRRMDGGTAELCGLWSTKDCNPKFGLPLLLAMFGVSVTDQLLIKTMFVMGARHTLSNTRKIGFVLNDFIGDKGAFLYPDKRFVSRIGVVNTVTLETALARYREIMIKFRKNPCGVTTEKIREIPLTFSYDLILSDFRKKKMDLML